MTNCPKPPKTQKHLVQTSSGAQTRLVQTPSWFLHSPPCAFCTGRSLATASGGGQAIDLRFERSPFKLNALRFPRLKSGFRRSSPKVNLKVTPKVTFRPEKVHF